MKNIIGFLVDNIGVFIVIIAIIVLPLFIVVGISYRIAEIEIEATLNESHIGENYVLNGDTMTIIDYSYLGSTYTLSNGVKINEKLVIND